MSENEALKEAIAETLFRLIKSKKIKISKEEITRKIAIPPTAELGDFAFPCFFLGPLLKEEPSDIALELREDFQMKGVKEIQTQGAYMNFFLDRQKLTEDVLSEAIGLKEKFGGSNIGKGKEIMVEFSQANTHKAFHVGHIRGTSIGESLARILEFNGHKVIRANYQGDSGMHVAKWLWCYIKYHSKEKLKEDESWVASIYVDAAKRLEKNKKLQEEVDEINLQLDSGTNKKLNDLWKKTRALSLKSLEKIYKQLNTHFDVYYFEKDMEERGKKIVEFMLKEKIAKESDGAIIMNLEKYNLGVWVLIRKDGTALYSAKDLALVEKKFSQYPELSRAIYVIANEQNLHFNQLVKTLELIKSKHYEKLKHVSFGLVRLPEGKMSSRTGQNVLYSDFLEKVILHAKKEIKKRYPKLPPEKLNERALKISIASIKYSMLKQGEEKDIVFDIKEAVNFEGNSGPYIQYSYARANSILKKAKSNKTNPKLEKFEDKETELIQKMSLFPSIVEKAYEDLAPSVIANYAYQLSQVFNEFYHTCPVIGSEEKEDFRLMLVQAFTQILKNSLYLLGIDVLEEM
ncbi:MAG TPA: arginine--tRNA ligase [Candidatus Omnitrophota bacterium]|nr:arginine--tRNA ligase [Candidatus Omnitrophota bacterium]